MAAPFTSWHFNVLPPTLDCSCGPQTGGVSELPSPVKPCSLQDSGSPGTVKCHFPTASIEPQVISVGLGPFPFFWGGVRSFSKAFLYVLKAVSYKDLRFLMGFPGVASGKEPACQCRKCKRCGFEPWVGKIPWRRAWQHTPLFLPGESHEQRSLAGYSP